MGRWCIASTLFQALIIGFTNINYNDKKYIIDSKMIISLLVIFATIQKVIVDVLMFYVLTVSLKFLLQRYV